MKNSLKSFGIACLATIAFGVQHTTAKEISQSIDLNKDILPVPEQQHSLNTIDRDINQDFLIGSILQPQGLSIQLAKPMINATAKAVELLAAPSEPKTETETATNFTEIADKIDKPAEPAMETLVEKNDVVGHAYSDLNKDSLPSLEQQPSLTISESKDEIQDFLIGEILQPQSLSIQLVEPMINATANAVEILTDSSEPETETATDSTETTEKMAQPSKPEIETPVEKHDTPAVSISGEEKDLLARLVEAEAKGEPYEGKVAVATVVLNRVESPQFPNTVTEVINEVVGHAYAFSPVQNGEINNLASAESTKAVEEAFKREDTLNGSIFFYNPEIATDDWIRSREAVETIGNHVFAK